jgi:hypothetical protein
VQNFCVGLPHKEPRWVRISAGRLLTRPVRQSDAVVTRSGFHSLVFRPPNIYFQRAEAVDKISLRLALADCVAEINDEIRLPVTVDVARGHSVIERAGFAADVGADFLQGFESPADAIRKFGGRRLRYV